MNTPSSYRHTRQWYKAVPGYYAQGLLQGRVFLNCDLILFTFRITVYAIFVVLVFQHLCDQILALLLHQFAPFRLLLSGHCGVNVKTIIRNRKNGRGEDENTKCREEEVSRRCLLVDPP